MLNVPEKAQVLWGFFYAYPLADAFFQCLPAPAVDYCRRLKQHYGFVFRVVRPRRTRLGDFRVLPGGQTQITVNSNLNPFAFLITYVHEVAHADVQQRYKRRVQPHGKAWQTAFGRLMQPLLTETVFPPAILKPLTAYLMRPSATTSANSALMQALRLADPQPHSDQPPGQLLLSDVPEGQSFLFAKKTFVRGTLRRTRIVCKEVTSGKLYAILSHVCVETV